MKHRERRLVKMEQHLQDLNEEIRGLLIQLYGTDNPSPALLQDLLLLSRTKRMSDEELVTYIHNEYATLTQEPKPCA